VPARLATLVLALGVVLAAGCAGGRAARGEASGPGDEAARETLRRFASALEAGRFEEAHGLLSPRWRGRTTPARLAADFAGAGPSAREAARRTAEALAAGVPLEREGAIARLPVGPDRAAVLVREGETWRVDALE
jgi:hypothetical protein